MWNSSGGSSRASSYSKKRGSNAHQPSIDEDAAEKMFAEIADDDDPTVAGMEGISTLCDKLQIDPLEDIRILVLLWKMGSKEKPAQITKEEWMAGCQKLKVDSVDKLNALLPSLDTGFLDRTDFRDFYKVRIATATTVSTNHHAASHHFVSHNKATTILDIVLLSLQPSWYSPDLG
jgi:hypothetical protein